MMFRQRGLSLIEVLVAIFILAVGLLGLAAMQLQSLKFTQGSQWRSQANFLAYDIVERVRANRSNVSSYVIAMDTTTQESGTSVAENDLITWRNQLAETIPGGRGSVAWDDGALQLTVVIEGDDQERVGDAEANMSFTFVTTLEPLNASPGGGSEPDPASGDD